MLNYRSADTLFRRASGTVACVSVLALTHATVPEALLNSVSADL